ncbi:MAG: hypothetical protein HYS32_00250 [Candidatus Woesearchaeota archaeon]|nr:MAG: hypothetical protein HYS32_00250 [Candidatus Woesearchaeota archaeon]
MEKTKLITIKAIIGSIAITVFALFITQLLKLLFPNTLKTNLAVFAVTILIIIFLLIPYMMYAFRIEE